MTYATTRVEVQRVATHVLARARHAAEGRIGLQVTPGGIGTPVFGPGVRLRIEGLSIVREDRRGADRCPLTTMTACAIVAGVDLDAPFSAGHDTVPVGQDAIRVERRHVERLMAFFASAWDVLTVVRAAGGVDPSEITLWPEHFDAAFVTKTSGDDRAGVGASPGDGFSDEPYFYVGPWGPDRPGDPAFWNAPFGAMLRTTDPAEAAAFCHRGLELLRG